MNQEYNQLPEELEQIGIEDLQNEELAYVVPWAIWIKKDREALINGHYSFSAEEHGTQSMRIKRRGPEILVDMASLGNSKFSRSEQPPHVGARPEDYLPVKFVKGNL
ncbi:hypothetical protein HY085_02680 [Candidatus Gottesmanbacteria bacterium]|nr:hypothetical protein [Candidatus Gottesmanbacteria bacterium]